MAWYGGMHVFFVRRLSGCDGIRQPARAEAEQRIKNKQQSASTVYHPTDTHLLLLGLVVAPVLCGRVTMMMAGAPCLLVTAWTKICGWCAVGAWVVGWRATQQAVHVVMPAVHDVDASSTL